MNTILPKHSKWYITRMFHSNVEHAFATNIETIFENNVSWMLIANIAETLLPVYTFILWEHQNITLPQCYSRNIFSMLHKLYSCNVTHKSLLLCCTHNIFSMLHNNVSSMLRPWPFCNVTYVTLYQRYKTVYTFTLWQHLRRNVTKMFWYDILWILSRNVSAILHFYIIGTLRKKCYSNGSISYLMNVVGEHPWNVTKVSTLLYCRNISMKCYWALTLLHYINVTKEMLQ